MDIDSVRDICKGLPAVMESVKWGNDLCFMVGDKMFCVILLETPIKISIKVNNIEFDEMMELEGIKSAPYAARHKWVLIENTDIFDNKKWEFYITQSYTLVKEKLSKKKLNKLM